MRDVVGDNTNNGGSTTLVEISNNTSNCARLDFCEMSTLSFDSQGYLKPYEINPIDWEEFEELFVFNHRRANIFIEFKGLISKISSEGITKFSIWVDGSFATLKTNPKDMDLVCFIDYREYEQSQKSLAVLRNRFSLLDIYFIKKYPEEHESHFLTNFDQLDWLHFFTRDRQNNKKGILKLTFG